MFVLSLRSIIVYGLVFAVIRLTGKRQISDLQPFDLIVTLLVADLAAEPASDTGIPLMYGIVPILTLFLVQQAVLYMSLKSEKARRVVSGEPTIVISRGVVIERALRVSRYTLNDLMEQLRGKDIFEISDVEFAVLETNGSLSVLLKAEKRQPDYSAMSLAPPVPGPPFMLVQDGKVHHSALKESGHDMEWLTRQLARCSVSASAVFIASLAPDGTMFAQLKESAGGKTFSLKPSAS